MTTTTARRDILAAISSDIRRVSGAHVEVTLDVALSNWEYFFEGGRWTEARTWWAVVARLMSSK